MNDYVAHNDAVCRWDPDEAHYKTVAEFRGDPDGPAGLSANKMASRFARSMNRMAAARAAHAKYNSPTDEDRSHKDDVLRRKH